MASPWPFLVRFMPPLPSIFIDQMSQPSDSSTAMPSRLQPTGNVGGLSMLVVLGVHEARFGDALRQVRASPLRHVIDVEMAVLVVEKVRSGRRWHVDVLGLGQGLLP